MAQKILLIDDEEDIVKVLASRLTQEGYEVSSVGNSKEALPKALEFRPDLILLDIMMPELDGFKVREQLNQQHPLSEIPIIFLTALGSSHDKVKGLRQNVDDYITKPFDKDELFARIASVLERRKHYESLSMTDGLTGLYNIHFLKRQLQLLFQSARRYKRIFSIVVIDIDKFKQVNDQYGHLAGDFVLKKTADIMKKVFRNTDVITRYGGDEFVVLMPETDEKATMRALQRLKKEILGRKFIYNDKNDTVSFSLSTGYVEYSESIKNIDDLFAQADAKMYQDKSK